MIPPRILEGFEKFPREIVDLCRPHPWVELTTPPREGMKPIRDILVHMVGAEAYWIGHVIRNQARQRFDPKAFDSLDAILLKWVPQRAATLDVMRALTTEDRVSRRTFPWDVNQSASVEEIVWHVVTHEQYHRGQVFTRLALLGRHDLPDHDLLR
ncbi:MAG: DinB family protein [Armatimonadota bacterium]|nr:DinB family protein [Armatimonadota bacterium]